MNTSAKDGGCEVWTRDERDRSSAPPSLASMAPSLEAPTQPATKPITAHAKPEPGETPDLDLSGGEDDDSVTQDDAGQASGTESGEPSSVPLQKRRRVTRVRPELRPAVPSFLFARVNM